jgi:hypothetical protein
MGGCTISQERPVFVDGEESAVQARSPERDSSEGWSVTLRPYRPRPTPELLRDVGSGVSCLLAGNRVLLADGTHKAIELVQIGDLVATMSGPAIVRAAEITRLGMTRKVVELRGWGDECLIMSDDHPVWVSRRTSDGAVRESWGTYNLNHVLYEMRNMGGYDLAETPVPLNFDLPEQLAHVNGWIHVRPIYHHLPPDTALYHLVVGGAFSYIAEGFPVFSHCFAADGPATPWHGLTSARAVERSQGVATVN